MRFLMFFCASMCLGSNLQAQAPDFQKILLISRAVVAMNGPSAFRQGLRSSPRVSNEDAYFKERAIALPDEVLVQLMSETYSDRLSTSEAKQVADFYTGPVGRKLTDIQARNPANPNPSYSEMTAAELDQARQFFASPAGIAFRNAGRDPAYFTDLTKRIQNYVISHPK